MAPASTDSHPADVPLPACQSPQQTQGRPTPISAAISALWGIGPPNRTAFLYAFGGLDRDDSVDSFVQTSKPDAIVLTIDLERSDAHNLECDSTWGHLVTLLRANFFAASLWSPPCCTFSSARKHGDGGPPPLRGASANDIYGLPGLSVADRTRVRTGTLLAVRTATGLLIQIELGTPWVYETPAPREGAPHMTLLPEFKPILDCPEVLQVIGDQCMFGARAAKGTLFLLFKVNIEDVSPELRPRLCTHPRRWWTIPWSGHEYRAPHPIIKGRQWAVPSEEWHSGLLQNCEPRGEFISRSMAAYPTGLNRALATWLVGATATPSVPAVLPPPLAPPPALVKTGAWGNALAATSHKRAEPPMDAAAELLKPTVHKLPRLTPSHSGAHTAAPVMGGMRRTAKCVPKMHLEARVVGARLRYRIGSWLSTEPNALQTVLASITVPSADTPARELCPSLVARARDIMAEVLSPASTERSPVSEIYADLLAAWRRAAHDPDDRPEHWAAHGAPGGVTMDIEDRGIFQCYDSAQDVRDIDPDELATEPDFVNYEGVEDDDLVADELNRLEQASWVLRFADTAAAAEYLGAEPVFSRIGVITKKRLGKIKRRIVADAKRSQVSAASRKFQRVELPRITDVVVDTLEQLAETLGLDASQFEFFIADFADAFFHVPLHRQEQRFFTFRFRGQVYVLLRTAQGSRGAPLTWARTAALLARLTQTMFPTDVLRLNVYVDDPIMAIRGGLRRRDLVVATVMLVWSALGFTLSLRKAKRAHAITWTSAHLKVYQTGQELFVSAQTKQELVDDARELTLELMAANVIPKKKLRQLAGKASHIGSLIFALRPFVAELWAALYATDATWAPSGCIWTSQVRHTLVWLAAFFSTIGASTLTRHFSVSAMFNKSTAIELILDASPWGLGAALLVDGTPAEYISTPLTADDERLLNFTIGSCEAQQTVEALVVLVAYRTWAERLCTKRCTVAVKSDSMSALYMLSTMSSKGHGSRIIARELALVFSGVCHRPDFVAHIPGVANKIADELSRKYEPSHTFALPSLLSTATERWVPVRDRTYYATLSAEPARCLAARDTSG